ncbi:MAG: glycosyltransferase family 39 protein, partial [Actinobacteria bacterium]|nr:glycosyltransferase family 39 protein [Actinomycetota bacterium]
MPSAVRWIGLLVLFAAYAAYAVRISAAEAALTDESGYLQFAQNLVHGFYSPPDALNLWWGPGYPLVLTPIVGLHIPLVVGRVVNALFMVAAVILEYLTLRRYVWEIVAFAGAAYLAVNLPIVHDSQRLVSESFSLLLVSIVGYTMSRLANGPRAWPWVGAGAAALAWLALTKVFFGYVLATLLV